MVGFLWAIARQTQIGSAGLVCRVRCRTKNNLTGRPLRARITGIVFRGAHFRVEVELISGERLSGLAPEADHLR
jgi:hypothetical protein